MNRFIRHSFFKLLLWCGVGFGISLSTASAQPEFYMRDTLVTECQGILYDSELGELTGHYAHNEDYSFTICIAGADEILLDFTYFHSEEVYDEITFYDGPDATAPLLAGPYSGQVAIPTVVATSGCLTIRFTSDANVAEPGWRAEWRTSNFSPPEPPILTALGPLSCPLTTLDFELSYPVHCDSLYADAFTITGPKFVAIDAVTPINCVGDSATRFSVSFTPALDFSGTYTLDLRLFVPYCTTPYELHAATDFLLQGCPLAVRLLVANAGELCEGGTTRVTAEVSGGIRDTYQYTWSPFPSTEDTVRVGPITGPTLVSVDVVDAAGNSATAQIVIEPAVSPTILGGDQTMCQSVGLFELAADPPGGEWEAAGLYYEYDRTQTTYDPLLTNGISDTIRYTAPNGCTTQAVYTFTALDVGTDDGACPGAAPFTVSGGLPAGGTWSGPNIDAAGVFTPPGTTGSWTVTYTHPNGCAGSKEIFIDNPGVIAQDTFCESEPRVELQMTPQGGVWSGPGIFFGDRGWFYPGDAGPGPQQLTYEVEGCAPIAVDVFVKEIDAYLGFSACPIEDPFILPGNWRPAGGTWYGPGIIDPSAGLFDPGLFGRGTDTLVYLAPNGCSEARLVSVFYTFTEPQNDTIDVCTQDDPFQLSEGGPIFQRPLDTGTWLGTGVTYDADSVAYFDPQIAGLGIHQIEYLANTCSAYNWVRVGESPGWMGDTICLDEDPVQLAADVVGTEWAGPGIINSIDGIFDPASVGEGSYEIIAIAPEGCVQRAMVEVPPDINLLFTPPTPQLCYNSTPIDLGLSPADATVVFNDGVLPLQWSSANLGEGDHTLYLQAGAPGCVDFDSIQLQVLAPLTLLANPYTDTLCEGEGTRIDLEIGGGLESVRQVTWADRPNWPSTSRIVNPSQTTTYQATLGDGCSDDVLLQLPVTVNPGVQATVVEGPIVCHYDSTFSIVEPLGNSTYEVRWQLPGQELITEQYAGPPGFYEVVVEDTETGCATELEVRLPGWPVVEASFSLNPTTCIQPNADVVTLLDRSRGAIMGTWSLPDGTSLPYSEGVNEQLRFPDTGTYEIVLYLENEGGCTSSDTAMVCVELPSQVFLPTAFTPNGDGVNEEYFITGQGVSELTWVVVDRWGTIIFTGDSFASRWDGTYKNEALPSGIFTLRVEYQDAMGHKQEAQGLIHLLR